MALATTIFYQAGWTNKFSPSCTITDIFHSPQGDLSWAFMQQTITQGTYYQGADYGAVALYLNDGSRMQALAHAENTQLVLIGQWDAVQEAVTESLL